MADRIKKLALMAGDFTMLWGALLAALAVRQREFTTTSVLIREHFAVFTGLFILWLVVFAIVNLYELGTLRNNLEFFIAFGKALFVNGVISVGLFYFLPGLAVTPKTTLFLMLGFALVLIFVWRRLFNDLIGAQFLQKKSISIGWDAPTLELLSALDAKPQFGYQIQGVVKLEQHQNPALDLALAAKELTLPLLELPRYVEDHGVERVIVSPEAYAEPGLPRILHQCLLKGVKCLNVSTLFETTLKRVPLTLLSHLWFLEEGNAPHRRAYEFFKRLLDLTIAILMGVLLFIPCLTIAFAIKWNSRGPVFYRQKRVGKGGKSFWLFKFRSMIANDPFGGAEGLTGARFTEESDPRITRVGRLIRKTHLDEWGQLWNILKGEMSFIGPRPERPEFYEQWRPLIPFFEGRLLVKPGITGWAQLHYTYGDTPEAASRNLQYDLYFIKHRSLLLDIGIMIKTVRIL